MSRLLHRGRIPLAGKERVILRVAHHMGCAYEWAHHSVMAQDQGVSRREVDSITLAQDGSWSTRTRALLEATDELLDTGRLSPGTLSALRGHLSDDACVELCMVVGHYVMGAMIINTSGCEIEPPYRSSLARSRAGTGARG
ncbi:carboxymuconolactone decarboxylase family protein [Streptomyces sp. NPDC052040]|uniref:carboxymuconolactone decarboxylase family protein n=1 Tax=Streptomyces sp. NPDC052040 TaxID=3365682 RepID=UPI0037CDB7F0